MINPNRAPAEPAASFDTLPDRFNLDALYRRYRASIRRLVSGLLENAGDADDVVQDAFLRVWQKMANGVIRADPRGYIYQSAINAARDRNRHRRLIQRHEEVGVLPDVLEQNDAPVDEVCDWRQAIVVLEGALAELDPAVRTVFILYHLDGMSVITIAERIGKSTRTIERYLASALAHCAGKVSLVLGSRHSA